MSRLILHIGMPNTDVASIQNTLFALGELGDFTYASLGNVNHSGFIASLFSENSCSLQVHKIAGRSQEEVNKFNQEVSEKLEAICSNKKSTIISGEGIWHMSETALYNLREYFEKHFQSIEVIGYVRSPESFISSVFEQQLKNNTSLRLAPKAYYPHYRFKFEKFDRVFGQENVTLRLFDQRLFFKKNIVTDFCKILGQEIELGDVKNVNESLSLEATAVLFHYRRNGPKYAPYGGKSRDNSKFIALLSKFGNRKLRFDNVLIEPILKHHREDITWMESRLDQLIIEDPSFEEDTIASEAQLLDIAMQQIAALEDLVNQGFEESQPTPTQLALWVEKLRASIVGRDSKGTALSFNIQDFFMEGQMELLKEDNLTPVIALRELALAFERHGRLDEAKSVIEAALVLRPDANGLNKLKQRIMSRF